MKRRHYWGYQQGGEKVQGIKGNTGRYKIDREILRNV